MVFFCLKNTIKKLKFGDYIWDDLIIYIAEVCRGIETLELNSNKLTDGSITHLLKRAEHLTALDVSMCPSFTGMAFAMVEDENFRSKQLRWVRLTATNHEQKMV